MLNCSYRIHLFVYYVRRVEKAIDDTETNNTWIKHWITNINSFHAQLIDENMVFEIEKY